MILEGKLRSLGSATKDREIDSGLPNGVLCNSLSQIMNEGHDKAHGLDSMSASEFKSISEGHRAGGAIFTAAQ